MSFSFQPSEGFTSRYRLGERLGRGAAGYVFRATQIELGREVALKLIPLAEAGEMRSLERFEAEARALAALRHPGILRLYDHGVDGDVLYLAMELATGRTLGDEVRQDGPFRSPQAIAAGLEVAAALDHLHSNCIVHRDVKPDNVFRAADGRLVLGDFGLALAADGPTAHTTASMVVGTPRYMAPELLEGVPHSPGTDLYALGVMLYELLAGRSPFLVEGTALLEKMRSEPVTPVRTLAPDVPAALARLVDGLLDRLPERRPADAIEVGAALAAMEPALSAGWVRRRPTGARSAPAPAAATPADSALEAAPTPRPPVRSRVPQSAAAPTAPRRAAAAWPLAVVPVGVAVALALIMLRPSAPVAPPSPSPSAPADEAPAPAATDAAGLAQEALLNALRKFETRRRAEGYVDAWRTFSRRPEGAAVAARRRHVELAVKDARRALEEHDVLGRLRAFHAAVAGRTAVTHPLAARDLPLYLALHELADLGTCMQSLRTTVSPTDLPGGPLDPLVDGPLPLHWQDTAAPTIENPHAISLVAQWTKPVPQPLPDPPYASHQRLRGWVSPYFGDLAYDDLPDFMERSPESPPPGGLGFVRHEHPDALALPAPSGVVALEVGLDCRPSKRKARFVVKFGARGRPWRTVAVLARGRAGSSSRESERWFLRLHPELVRGPELRVALELVTLPGIMFNYNSRADWLTLRWRYAE